MGESNRTTGFAAEYAAVRDLPTDELVEKYAHLVRRIAYHLGGRLPASVDINDLVQAGMLGLMEAARKYAGDRGANFETYAGIRIRGRCSMNCAGWTGCRVRYTAGCGA
ncbi:sigma factor [Haliea sp.]